MPTKPTRIKHSALAILFNDIQLDRGTSFGCTGALNTEEIREIGNIGIVEILDGIPTVDATCDTNEYGSIKTIAALANKKFDYGYVQARPHASSGHWVTVISGDYYLNERKYNLASNSDQSFVSEIAALSGGYSQIGVLSIASGGAISKTMGDAAVDPTAPTTPANDLKICEVYLTSGMLAITEDWILNMHDLVTVEITDYELAKVDIVMPVKETGDNLTADYVTRACYVENAFCNRLDMSFNTGGVSTNTFGMESDNKRWFLGTKRTIVVDRFIQVGGGTYTLSQTPAQLDNSNYLLRCRVFTPSTGLYSYDYVEGTDFTVNPTTKVVTFTNNPAAGDVLIMRYCADINTSVSFQRLPGDELAHPSPPGGLAQGQIEIYLADDLNNMVLRIESCTISASLTREALNEIGHQLPYDRPLTLPVPVTVTLNTTASNLEEFARMMGKGAEFDAGTLNELNINDFAKDLGLVVKMYREPDTKRSEKPFKWQPYLKQVSVEDLSITDEGFDVRLDANMTQTFSLKADNLTISGRI